MDGHPPPTLPSEIGWHNWGQIFTDVALWRPVVAHICRKTAVAQAAQVESGYPGTCAVFVVDRQVVVKLFPPMLLRDFYREREVYHALDGRLAALPQLLAVGVYPDRLDWPYLVVEFCEGQPIRELYRQITPGNKVRLAQEIGLIIRTIHETPLDDLASFDKRPLAWQRFLNQRRAACLSELRYKTPLLPRLLAEIDAFLDDVGPLVAPSFRPVLLHADLTADHLLLVEQNGQWRISALLDWADAEVGTPEYEWVALWFGLCGRDPLLLRTILHEVDVSLRFDEAFCRRMMAYTLLHRFGAAIITELLQGNGNPVFDSLAELQQWLWPLC